MRIHDGLVTSARIHEEERSYKILNKLAVEQRAQKIATDALKLSCEGGICDDRCDKLCDRGCGSD